MHSRKGWRIGTVGEKCSGHGITRVTHDEAREGKRARVGNISYARDAWRGWKSTKRDCTPLRGEKSEKSLVFQRDLRVCICIRG